MNEYHAYIRKFPGVMSGKVRGSKPREHFEVNDAANREAPTGDFNATPAAPAIAAPAAKP